MFYPFTWDGINTEISAADAPGNARNRIRIPIGVRTFSKKLDFANG